MGFELDSTGILTIFSGDLVGVLDLDAGLMMGSSENFLLDVIDFDSGFPDLGWHHPPMRL